MDESQKQPEQTNPANQEIQFLIDTKAIRNGPNPFAFSKSDLSNRHKTAFFGENGD